MRPDPRLVVESCEHRADRGPADQPSGGVVHTNGSHIVSQDTSFLAACVRHMLGFTLPKQRRAA